MIEVIKTKYKTREEKIGEVVSNKHGTPMKLIEYRNSLDCDVEFQDEYKYIFEHTAYQNFKQGKIKNPYDKTVFGIGMLGDGKYMSSYTKGASIAKDYNIWQGMIERSYKRYDENERFPAYYEITTVCDEWLNFQVFAEWYETNWYEIPDGDRLELDKDILNPGNKHYSPDNCLLVPQSINLLFTNMGKNKNDGLPNGLVKSKNGQKYIVNCMGNYLGTYPTVREAYSVYSLEKEKTIKERADAYKEYIPQKLYDALYRFEVKIENDKNCKSS